VDGWGALGGGVDGGRVNGGGVIWRAIWGWRSRRSRCRQRQRSRRGRRRRLRGTRAVNLLLRRLLAPWTQCRRCRCSRYSGSGASSWLGPRRDGILAWRSSVTGRIVGRAIRRLIRRATREAIREAIRRATGRAIRRDAVVERSRGVGLLRSRAVNRTRAVNSAAVFDRSRVRSRARAVCRAAGREFDRSRACRRPLRCTGNVPAGLLLLLLRLQLLLVCL